ncbi:Holliday junction resolvase Hjc [uncultured archaeon]|nr:Holliday junction resolvase Hjc [uncultured archaeon]
MAHYNKGANAERELLKLVWDKGFVVARTAGSGKNPLPMPDLIVMGKGRSIIIEAKAWRANNLTIIGEKMGELFKWRDVAGAEVYIAWKYPNKGWFFIRPETFRKAKNYSISIAEAQRHGLLLDVLLGEQRQLPLQ